VTSSNEHGKLSEYRPPEPKLKILKRPQSSPSNLSAQGGVGNGASGKGKTKPKSLKQREEEYAQARLRILGSAGHPDDAEEGDVSGGAPAKSASPAAKGASTAASAVIKPAESAKRTPRGPDGTKGFHRESQ
jgi:hypothetical protein